MNNYKTLLDNNDLVVIEHKKKQEQSETFEELYHTYTYIEIESISETAVLLMYDISNFGMMQNFYFVEVERPFGALKMPPIIENFAESRTMLNVLNNFADKIINNFKKNDENLNNYSKWKYLGTMSTDIIMNRSHAIYALDVSGMSFNDSIKIHKVPVRDAIRTKNSYILVPFIKLYLRFFDAAMEYDSLEPEDPEKSISISSLQSEFSTRKNLIL